MDDTAGIMREQSDSGRTAVLLKKKKLKKKQQTKEKKASPFRILAFNSHRLLYHMSKV